MRSAQPWAALNEAAAEDEGVLASINIIPFVDIVLVLLVIFMLTSAAIVRASLRVELPKAASGGSRVESTINLIYGKDDKLLLNGNEVPSLAEAGRLIRSRGHRQPQDPGGHRRRQERRLRHASSS